MRTTIEANMETTYHITDKELYQIAFENMASVENLDASKNEYVYYDGYNDGISDFIKEIIAKSKGEGAE